MASQITIRPWAKRDRDTVQGLLSLLGPDAVVVAGDAPTYVAEADGGVVGMVTVCVFTTLTGNKARIWTTWSSLAAGDGAALPGS